MDEDAPEYRALHPNKEKSKKNLVSEHFDLVSESDEERNAETGGDSDAGSSSSDDNERLSRKSRQKNELRTGEKEGRKRKAPQPRCVLTAPPCEILQIFFLHTS